MGKWKGDGVSYSGLHAYLRYHYPKAGVCEGCGREGRTDYALKEGREYSRSREDYWELCHRCHMIKDGIPEKMTAGRQEQRAGERAARRLAIAEKRDDREWLNTGELADWLGIDVKAVYWMNYTGNGPRRHKIGRGLLYRRSDVELWLRGQAL